MHYEHLSVTDQGISEPGMRYLGGRVHGIWVLFWCYFTYTLSYVFVMRVETKTDIVNNACWLRWNYMFVMWSKFTKTNEKCQWGSWLFLDLPLFTGVIYCSKFTGKLHLVAPWQWTSYPSGRSAIVYCSAGAELGRSGYYLIAYDDSNEHRMLACFTPAGKGVCYSTNGNIRLFDNSLTFLKLDLTISLQLI